MAREYFYSLAIEGIEINGLGEAKEYFYSLTSFGACVVSVECSSCLLAFGPGSKQDTLRGGYIRRAICLTPKTRKLHKVGTLCSFSSVGFFGSSPVPSSL